MPRGPEGRGQEDPAPVARARTESAACKPSLLGLPPEKLLEAVSPVVDQGFRARQIYRAIHERGVATFAAMTDLPLELRHALDERFDIALPTVKADRCSADGTAKLLIELEDGKTIETVDIPDGNRRTVCISSQAGCALGCRFCVTGYWGAGRNLSAAEIIAQVRIVESRPRPETHGLNLVFMGMGEPLLNLDNLHDALEILLERISWRRITVSTVGILPAIEAMADWPRRPELAISLHAPDDDRRSQLMPVNRSYPLDELMALLKRYPLRPRERITFEYVLIRHLNDALSDADALARLAARLPSKVNLIPINRDPVLGDEMVPPAPQRVVAFRDRLRERGVVATVRRRRGDDVSAACGQLRAVGRAARGFRRSNLRF